MKRSPLLLVATLAATAGVTACTTSTPEREQNSPDLLLADRSDVSAEYEGYEFRTGPATEAYKGECVAVFEDEELVIEGCGVGPSFVVSSPQITLTYFTEPHPRRDLEGFVRVTDQIFVRDS